MDEPTEVFCPKCKGIPKAVNITGPFKTHICFPNCGYVYWNLQVCPFCNDPTPTIFHKKPNLGEKITCNNCRSSFFYFICPQANCRELFHKK